MFTQSIATINHVKHNSITRPTAPQGNMYKWTVNAQQDPRKHTNTGPWY